jgi:hypothetical protein
MPTISIFYGIVVQMYWRDHAPPHFHAYYQGFEGLFDISTGEVIAGQLPPKPRKIVKEWAALNQSELLENWERGKRREDFKLVKGADA